MRFYQKQHQFYAGIDLHTKKMYLCVLDSQGEIVLHRNLNSEPHGLLRSLQPFRSDVVVGVECTFSWYWLADACRQEQIPFVLGHALYMRAIHGGKVKNDKIDSEKIARMLRGGMFPLAYSYPAEMRATRDLLRRRCYFVRRRAELLAHLQNTFSQYNVPTPAVKMYQAVGRLDLPGLFEQDSVQRAVAADVAVVAALKEQVRSLDRYLIQHARVDDALSYQLLQTIPGVGELLALVMLYEIHDITRFAEVGHFVSYARLVSCAHESAGKRLGSGGRKIGNAHLKWAFSEAACLMLRDSEEVKRWVDRWEKQYGRRGRALNRLAAELARAVYWMLRRKQPFDAAKFFGLAPTARSDSAKPAASKTASTKIASPKTAGAKTAGAKPAAAKVAGTKTTASNSKRTRAGK
jgi:transposase